MKNFAAHTAYLWIIRVVAALGVGISVVAAALSGSMLVHGHPAYLILLVLIFVVSAVILARGWPRRLQQRLLPAAPARLARRRAHRLARRLARGILVAASAVMIASVVWLVPSTADAPAITAMRSDNAVMVAETPTEIVLTPTAATDAVGVFFQPGARVDARAYTAILRPLASAGHLVVITKQPLGIAFLATGAFAAARAMHHPVTRWVLGGHSLGGLIAATDAENFAAAAENPVVGLFFFASYPATDLSKLTIAVLSISGSNDGLSTPGKVANAKPLLPSSTRYLVIRGGTHSYFGDYGAQSGDGTPAVSRDRARAQISDASVAFVTGITN